MNENYEKEITTFNLNKTGDCFLILEHHKDLDNNKNELLIYAVKDTFFGDIAESLYLNLGLGYFDKRKIELDNNIPFDLVEIENSSKNYFSNESDMGEIFDFLLKHNTTVEVISKIYNIINKKES